MIPLANFRASTCAAQDTLRRMTYEDYCIALAVAMRLTYSNDDLRCKAQKIALRNNYILNLNI
jgi:hypothetical protein